MWQVSFVVIVACGIKSSNTKSYVARLPFRLKGLHARNSDAEVHPKAGPPWLLDSGDSPCIIVELVVYFLV